MASVDHIRVRGYPRAGTSVSDSSCGRDTPAGAVRAPELVGGGELVEDGQEGRVAHEGEAEHGHGESHVQPGYHGANLQRAVARPHPRATLDARVPAQ